MQINVPQVAVPTYKQYALSTATVTRMIDYASNKFVRLPWANARRATPTATRILGNGGMYKYRGHNGRQLYKAVLPERNKGKNQNDLKTKQLKSESLGGCGNHLRIKFRTARNLLS